MKAITSKILSLIFVVSCNAQDGSNNISDYSLSEIVESGHLDKSKIFLLIDKSDFKMYVRIGSQILKDYPVVFGKNTVDDKLMQGDNCTPEGTFYMISKYPHKEWSKFIWLNYPNEESRRKHNAAKMNGQIPKNAKIGGEVGIHGVPKGMDFLIITRYNWTLGCISMKNKDVDELYPYILKTTKIEIRK
jgi:murein L,D-transpeptidase YafK